MEQEGYRVKVEGLGLSLERDVPKEVGDQVVVLIVTGGKSALPSKTPSISSQDNVPAVPKEQQLHGVRTHTDESPSVSIREFMSGHGASRNPDKIVCIGQYLQDIRRKPVFSRDDVGELFEAAAEPVPKNISRDIAWTVKIGWIAPKEGQQGAYYVTNTGTSAVQNKFPKEIVKKTKQGSGSSSRKIRKENPQQDASKN
jgi:hypothetical protein